MKKKSSFKQKAFTLIELLLVISIISLLTSIILSNLKEAREKAEDQATVSAAKELINAIELYRADHEGKYPYEDDALNNGEFFSTFVYNGSSGYITTTGIGDNASNNIFVLIKDYIKFNFDALPLEINSFPGTITPAGQKLFGYYVNGGGTQLSIHYLYRCSDRDEIPKYLVTFGVHDSNFLNLPTLLNKRRSSTNWSARGSNNQQKAICVY